jgi:hypothetical protein
MADTKLSALTELDATPATGDELYIRDVSEATADESKRITVENLVAAASNIANLDIDGGTDIGEAIVDADLFIVDNGAGGTNRKTAASRIKTYIGTAAVTRVGGDTSETTSTANSPTNLLAQASLTIAAATPYVQFVNARKDSNGADDCSLGLTINSTITGAPQPGTDIWRSSTTDRAEDGMSRVYVGSRVTNYLNPVPCQFIARVSSSGAFAVGNDGVPTGTNPFPNAEITTITITGESDNNANLIGADELHIYTYASS